MRSGVLTSVHAFATDPTRGVFILAILTIFIGGSLALFALRANALAAGGLFHPISREGALVLNNLFLTTAAATVFIGTLYPLFVEAVAGDKISVGAPFFDMTFGPLMLPLLVVVPFGPLLAWKRGDLFGVAQRLMAAFGGAILAMLVMLLFVDGASVFAALGVGLAAWLVLGALTDLATKSGIGSVAPGVALRRLVGLPRSVFGTALAHFGLGLTTLGIVSTLALQAESITSVKPGEEIAIAGYTLRFDGISKDNGSNYTEDQGSFALFGEGGEPLGDDRLGEALLPGPADADHRGRHQDAGFQPALRFARRLRQGRLDRRARLVEAAGHADLAGRPRHDVGSGGLAVRPQAARRRAGTAAQDRREVRGDDGMIVRRIAASLALLVVLGLPLPALAVLPGEMLADPALEARARALSGELRCMVCQNQSIDDSDADLAHDLRVLVRERLAAGDSDEEVIDYVVSRYGEFVLLKPRFSLRNALLWTAPVLLLVVGGNVHCSGRPQAQGRGAAAADGQGEACAGGDSAQGLSKPPPPSPPCNITKVSSAGNDIVMSASLSVLVRG